MTASPEEADLTNRREVHHPGEEDCVVWNGIHHKTVVNDLRKWFTATLTPGTWTGSLGSWSSMASEKSSNTRILSISYYRFLICSI